MFCVYNLFLKSHCVSGNSSVGSQSKAWPDKRMNYSAEFHTGGELATQALIYIENTKIVNWNLEFTFMYCTVPVFLVTLLLNTGVLGILWKMEKTMVNELIMLDCMVNIMFSIISTFQQSPFYRGMDADVYCSIHLVLFFATSSCNRLIPVSIAIYRYDIWHSKTRKY